MISAGRILKADSKKNTVSRVRWANLSETIGSCFDSSGFVPISRPLALAPRCEPQADVCLNTALTTLQVAADQLHARQDHWLDQSQDEAVRFGIAIAEHLLRRTLDIHPDAVLDLIRTALDWSPRAVRLRIRVHPADAELISNTSSNQPLDPTREIEFVSDQSLTRGDCVVETPNGQTDARLAIILQRIADELLAE